MSEPIVPPNHGLTEEAATALGLDQPPSPNGHAGTDSDEDNEPHLFSDFPSFTEMSDGSIVDAEIVDDDAQGPASEQSVAASSAKGRRSRNHGDAPPKSPREAKTGPPSLDEWTGFFSRVVLRVVTEYYISFAFRGINEDSLTEREIERLAMTDEERKLISVPFAEISHKSKFMRKHGRMIVASGDAFNAMVVLGMWASRVNRIAARYRPKVVKGHLNGSSGPSTPEATPEGSTGGRFPAGFNGYVQPGTG